MARPRKALLEPTDTTDTPTPPRVAEAASVADRGERMKLLSGIMRDGRATGAEVVAAGRLLEAMERTDATSMSQGIPPPTSRPEQVMRAVRFLTAAGPRTTCEALEILAQRYERARVVAAQNRRDGKLMDITEVDKYRKRLLPKEDKNGSREGKRFVRPPGGTLTAIPEGLPELHEPAEPVGPPPNSDESHGNGDEQVDSGAGQPAQAAGVE